MLVKSEPEKLKINESADEARPNNIKAFLNRSFFAVRLSPIEDQNDTLNVRWVSDRHLNVRRAFDGTVQRSILGVRRG